MTKKRAQTKDPKNSASLQNRLQTISPLVNENKGMGFNPHRKQKKRASDLYIVAIALVITLGLVVWAFTG